MVASVPALLQKVKKYRPRIVCFVGKGIWVIVEKGLLVTCNVSDGSPNSPVNRSPSKSPKKSPRSKSAKAKNDGYGLQPYKIVHAVNGQGSTSNVRETLFFVSPSSSGRVVSHQLPDKVRLFEQLRDNVQAYKDGKLDTSAMTPVST